MRRGNFYLLIISVLTMTVSCSKKERIDEKVSEEEVNRETFYDREKDREEILENDNLVLLYSGGAHRAHQWDENYLKPYVTYIDELGVEHWIFDSFLFLEIHNGSGKTFATGYTPDPANQQDWKLLADHYFQSHNNLGALNKLIERASSRIGKPEEKHKIVIGIPEPIRGQKDWGSLRDGQMLDFSKAEDRIEACKWYIDYVRSKFNEFDYKNLELSGFYWIAEEATNTRSILSDISNYLNDLKYGFIWIPYHGSDGAFQWKQLTFNFAYYQPNYFFNDQTPHSFLVKACEDAIRYNMDMEIEFDDRALDKYGWGYRLEDYIEAFEEYGIWEKKRIAYYQGDKTIYELANSNNSKDIELYHKFSKFVVERPK